MTFEEVILRPVDQTVCRDSITFTYGEIIKLSLWNIRIRFVITPATIRSYKSVLLIGDFNPTLCP